jgi:hypothetical protein
MSAAGCQPLRRQSSQTGTATRLRLCSVTTACTSSVDTVFPQAVQLATSVLFSLAFSLGMGSGGRLVFGFDDHGDVCGHTGAEVDGDHVLTEHFDRFVQTDAPPIDLEPGRGERTFDVDVRH